MVGHAKLFLFATVMLTTLSAAAAPVKSAPGKNEAEIRDQKAAARRDEALAELLKILPTFEEGRDKADLYFRLAELYWERAHYLEGTGREKEAQQQRQLALQTFDTVQKRYPTHVKMDQILFNKGAILFAAGKKPAALDVYTKLVERYPQSQYVPDSLLNLGDIYFAKNDLFRATVFFHRAAETKKPRIYSYATYRLAWCDYNAQEDASALTHFKQVVDYADAQKDNKKDRVQLREEALKDMLLVYSRTGAVDEAYRYYKQKLPPADVTQKLGRLGDLFFETGQHDAAVKAYKIAVADAEQSEPAGAWQARIVESHATLLQYDELRAEAKKLVERHKAKDGVEQALRELTTTVHHDAQKTKVEKTYAAARDLYELYLLAFPKSEHTYSMRFFFAELLYRQKQYDRAAEQFDIVSGMKGKYLKDALLGSVQAWELSAEAAKKRGKIVTPEEQRFIDACDRFAKQLPQDEAATKTKLKAAMVLFDRGRTADAEARLKDVAATGTDPKLRRAAAMRILDGLAAREQWTELQGASAQFAADRTLGTDTQFSTGAQELGEGAAFKLVQASEQNGDPRAAAAKYLEFAEKWPKSKFADTALHNAAVLADKAGDLEGAITATDRLLKAFPKAKTAETAAFLSASLYERKGDKAKALKGFQRYRALFPKGPRIQDADFNIAFFADALGKDKVAVAAFAKYVDDYPNAKDRLASYLKMGVIYERLRDHKAMAQHYAAFESRFKKEATFAQTFDAAYKQCKATTAWKGSADWSGLWSRYQRAPAAEKENEAVLSGAAEARFELSTPTYQRFNDAKLAGNRMADAFAKKVKLLADVEREYAEVLKLKNGFYGIAALTRIGRAYEEMAKSIRGAPVPRGLNGEQQEIYRSELESKAFPIEEKAIEAFEKALEKANELDIDSPWKIEAAAHLAALKGETNKVAVAN